MQSNVKNQILFPDMRGWAERLRQQRVPNNKPQDHRIFAGPPFDETMEQLFWHERHGETLSTLKAPLSLGAAGFQSFSHILDIAKPGSRHRHFRATTVEHF